MEMCHTQFTSKTLEYKWLQIHENHIYVNCDWRNEYKSDSRRYEYYWTGTENKNWKKKLRPVRDLNPEVMGGHGRSWVQIPFGLEFFFRPYFHY